MLGAHGFTRRVHRVECWAFGETLPPQARFFSEILTCCYRLILRHIPKRGDAGKGKAWRQDHYLSKHGHVEEQRNS